METCSLHSETAITIDLSDADLNPSGQKVIHKDLIVSDEASTSDTAMTADDTEWSSLDKCPGPPTPLHNASAANQTQTSDATLESTLKQVGSPQSHLEFEEQQKL